MGGPILEIETPILESSEVFRKSLGLTSDIIKKETYTFNDRSNNQIINPNAKSMV